MSKYVVLDLEMCKVSRGMKKIFGRSQETIQIGAVLLNDNYEVVDQFMTYVKPKHGSIDSFIKNLTGISTDDVYAAPDMETAMKSFLDWIPADDVKMVSWSMSDERQLRHEAEFYGIQDEKFEMLLANWIDGQEMFDARMDFDHACALEEALIATDICTEGRAHDGLVDAYNTALLFAKMETEPELKLNSYYQRARAAQSESLTCSFGDIMASFGILATA